MKLSLRILAWVHLAIGGIGLLICAAFVVSVSMASDPAYDDEIAFFGGLLGMLALLFFIPSFAGGWGLLARKPWARPLMWIDAAALALVVPIGTLLAGLNLWVLLSTREVSPDGGMAKFEARVRASVRPLAITLAALFILGVMLLLGYVFRDVISPPKKQELTPLPSGGPPIVSPAPAQ